MLRVKFVKNHKQYKVGEVATVSRNEAFGFIDSGHAVVSKDMTADDYKTSQTGPFKAKRRYTRKG